MQIVVPAPTGLLGPNEDSEVAELVFPLPFPIGG